MEYDSKKGFKFTAHDEFTDQLYHPNKVLFYSNPHEERIMPDDPNFAFIGANPGDTVWVLPQKFDPIGVSVGVSAEGIADGTFATYYEADPRVQGTAPWVKLTLVDVRGPGEVSVWQTDAFGQPVVWMATSDGITDNDAVFVPTTLDADYNWAFTAPGIYEIDVIASAYLPGEDDPIYSDVVTYTFGVEATEP
jgi:surface-anchored protein